MIFSVTKVEFKVTWLNCRSRSWSERNVAGMNGVSCRPGKSLGMLLVSADCLPSAEEMGLLPEREAVWLVI